MEKLSSQIMVHVTDETREQLSALALIEGLTASEYARNLINGHINERKTEYRSMQKVFGGNCATYAAAEDLSVNLHVKRLITCFGGQAKTAAVLGVAQATVSGWLNGTHGMHAVTAMKAEGLTDGDVLAVSLCPRLSELDQD